MRRALGWLLMVPAVVLGIVQIVVPAGLTVWASLFRTEIVGGSDGPPEFLGIEAYAEAELIVPVLLGLVIGVPAFLVAGLGGIAVGGLAAGASGRLRLAVRGVLGVLVVLYAPIGIGLAALADGGGGFGVSYLVGLTVLVVLPVGTALVALVVMAAAGPDGVTSIGRRVGAGAVLLGVGVVTAMAIGLQLFGLPLWTAGGRTEVPGVLIYQRAFQYFELSGGAAVSAVLLLVLAVLGVLVTIVLLAVGLRVEMAAGAGQGERSGRVDPAKSSSPFVGIAALVVAGLVLVVFLVLARGWVAGLAAPLPAAIELADAVRIGLITWLPPLVAVIVQVLVGALAGFGIGALRPLGRGSEWLLLLFAPGLFVSLTPLLTAKFLASIEGGWFADGPASLVPPLLVGIPALYVFTFVSAGLRRAWDADRGARTGVVLSGVATVVLVFVVSWVVQAQTITWNLIVANDPDRQNGLVTLARLRAVVLDDSLPQQLATPVPLLVVLAVVAAAAIVGLDRLRLRVGPATSGDADPQVRGQQRGQI